MLGGRISFLFFFFLFLFFFFLFFLFLFFFLFCSLTRLMHLTLRTNRPWQPLNLLSMRFV